MSVQRWFVYRYTNGRIEYLYEEVSGGRYGDPDWTAYAPKLYLTHDRAFSMTVVYGGCVGVCTLHIGEEE